jgi:hypothetical protein
MKPKKRTAFIIVALAIAAGTAWFGWFQFGPGSTSGSEPRLRYGSISIAQPSERSGLHAAADYAPPESSEKPGGGPVIVVSGIEPDAGYLLIDATTGEVLVDQIDAAHRASGDDVIHSIRSETAPEGVWPIADVPPPTNRMTHGNISYVQPDANSGIFVLLEEGDGPEGGGFGLFIHNGKSRMTVDGVTGNIDTTLVGADDKEAFERLADSVRVTPQ